jgi:ATP-dependent DNA helicase RecG
VSPDKKIAGQIVADGTLRDIAQCFKRFEPPAHIQLHRVSLPNSGREVIVLQASASYETRPFAFDERSYERVGSTTSVMPQETYQRLLLERAHAKQRWENLPAAVTLEDLDQDEILRTLKLGAAAGRMSASMSANAADVLDRLGLRDHDRALNAAVVVFGRHMLPDYPQCQLRMAASAGTDKTEFLDQRQLHESGGKARGLIML